MTVTNYLRGLVCAFAFLTLGQDIASAQLTIGNVVNAASRQTGIAQGELFAVLGKGVGTADIMQATFPLPTTDGLGGVTIQVNAGGQIIDCIMVYAKPNEVGAILPSSTPPGPATLTLNNNGAYATKDINVVTAAFGIFTLNFGFGAGLAAAFNVNADGTTTANSTTQSVQAGQDILINGTGLGAIPSDETQSGVTDTPGTAIQVWAGMIPATVVSAGRGQCCDGLDPAYVVPQGIAAWDVIRFTIPDGIVGCYIPIVVQIGTSVSNLTTISIDPSGAACTPPPSTVPPALVTQLAGQTGISTGNVSLSRGFGFAAGNGKINTTKKDTGSAAFVREINIDAGSVVPYAIFQENACTINGFPDVNGAFTHNGATVTIVPIQSVALDAGSPITVKGPPGTRTIVKRTAGALFDYPGANFGDTTKGNYFDAGTYSISSSGGPDVGSLQASINVPDPQFEFTNMPSVTAPIDRTSDLQITWKGGVPGTQVVVLGSSSGGGVSKAYLCATSVEAGQMTIPSYVLLSLPPSDSTVAGQLTVENASNVVFSAKGLDWVTLRYGVNYTLYLKYQ